MTLIFSGPHRTDTKCLLFAEEAGLTYTIKPVNIGRGEQFDPDFLRISPNNRIPALVDPGPDAGDGPISIFESGAIVLYLAEKTGQYLSSDLRGRAEVLRWLFWQMGGLAGDPLYGGTDQVEFDQSSDIEFRYFPFRHADRNFRH